MTMYINIWHHLANKEDCVFEHAISKTIKEAVKQYDEEDSSSYVYCHTLKIEDATVEKIYLGEHMPEEEANDIGGKYELPEYHEHKTLCAKFLNRC